MLITDWGQVLRRAWSVRLMVIAAVLSGAEAALPFVHQFGWLDFLPGGTFALLSFIVVAAAFIARFVAQRGINGR